jgi:Fic family protein
MGNLFDYLKKDKENHPLIKSCIAHYEIEFIHPFSDGNGRMGRLWQSIILTHYHPIFEYLPIESTIQKHQKKYYEALEISDEKADSSPFAEFILEMIAETLSEFLLSIKEIKLGKEERIEKAKEFFKGTLFSRKDFIVLFKDISAPTASRDLAWAFEEKFLTKSGKGNKTLYRFKS